MTVTAVHKDPNALTMTLTAEFDASPERALIDPDASVIDPWQVDLRGWNVDR